ncbi:MAG TPA: hypothetical protein VE890_13005 [Thermoguttaceae bacterium]|nr:hypothetical protein [Thermoguttaceae bacterium]
MISENTNAPNDLQTDAVSASGPSPAASVVLFFVFVAICFGLGYPALSRYVPWEAGNFDSRVYYHMVAGAPEGDPVNAPMIYRVLEPTMARGVLHVLSHFELGSWDPVWLSLLVVNSVFVALSASIIMRLAAVVSKDATVTALAPLIYMASFVVVNYHLAGMIDASEGFFLLAILLTLMRDRWWPLPILIAVGVLTKETVLPFGVTAMLIWWVFGRIGNREPSSRRAWISIGASLVGGSLVIATCRYLIDVPPYEAHVLSSTRFLSVFTNLWACLFERTQLYAFALLLPMGLPRLRRIPGRLLAASLGMAIAATLLGAYAGIQGNLHRPLFNTLGPVLAIAGAMFMRDLIVGRKRIAISQ